VLIYDKKQRKKDKKVYDTKSTTKIYFKCLRARVTPDTSYFTAGSLNYKIRINATVINATSGYVFHVYEYYISVGDI